MTFLSLCMILRDAENTLPTLLNSVAGCFDEYVFVDTGSKDRTLEILQEFATSPAKVVIKQIPWVDDFAAARQVSFEAATGKWRVYLDADDEFVNGQQLRAELEALEKLEPTANCLSLPYIYRQHDTEQETIRVFRWADGWQWQDEVHEFAECAVGRRFYVIGSVSVLHHKDISGNIAASERNARIAEVAYLNTEVRAKKARMASYIATHAAITNNYDRARWFFDEAIEHYNGNPFAMFTYEDAIRMEIQAGELDRALALASELAGRHPEAIEGPRALTIVHALRGDHARAIHCWVESLHKQAPNVRTLENVWWTQGVAATRAALSYLALGMHEPALATLLAIPRGIQLHEAVRHLFIQAHSQAMTRWGEKLASDYQDFLLWTCEPERAAELPLPPVLADSRLLHVKKTEIRERLQHMRSDADYFAAYAAIPAETYHTDAHHRAGVLALARAERILQHVEVLAKQPGDLGEGSHHAHRALSVGYQDGIIEAEMLARHPGLELVVADVAPQASQGFEELAARFPGRVTRHVMAHVNDVTPEEDAFDVVVAYEVIEHVPVVRRFVEALVSALHSDGSLFVSTPTSAKWIETHLSDFAAVKHPYWHVRSFDEVQLHRALTLPNTVVTECLEAHDSTYVARVQRTARKKDPRRHEIAIFVPDTPQPFNALSPETGFLGGSEEAVIRLAEALAETHDVRVCAPQPEGASYLRVWNNVVWSDPSKFVPQAGGVTLYWRCPQVMTAPLVQRTSHTKLLWLHDAEYRALPEHYAAADSVLLLSETHRTSISLRDGVRLHNADMFQNGIVPEHFPTPNEAERDPFKVIYVSSPERGLERLLDAWPIIKGAVPQATLDIYYDWTAFKKGLPEEHRRLWMKVTDLCDDGVTYVGGVDQPTLHAAMRKAAVWAYPNTGDVETFCISAVKVQAAGCWPVTSNAGALQEVISPDVPMVPQMRLQHPEGAVEFAQNVIGALRNPPSLERRLMLRSWALDNYTWKQAAKRLLDIIQRRRAP